MLQEKEEMPVAEIYKIKKNFNKNTPIIPFLHRCSDVGVEDFIAREASSYKCIPVGNIHNSVAKKSIDVNLRQECNVIQSLTIQDTLSEDYSIFERYSSDVSSKKIKDLLTTCLTKWVFQTSNSNKLVTFYAKSSNLKIELYVNFSKEGDASHLCLGDDFGYISPEVLTILQKDLSKVFSKVTAAAGKTELIWKKNNNKLEKLKMEDPDTWYSVKHQALSDFISEEKSFFEKILEILGLSGSCDSFLLHLFSKNTLTDSDAENYLLDSINIDIRQIYA